MNIALCAVFLEEDIWEKCLRVAAFPRELEITACNSAQSLLPVLALKSFSLLIVVLNGVVGLEEVRKLQEKAPDVPILWIADEDFSLLAYQYRVTYFLRRPVSDTALQEAVVGCLGI